MPVNLNQPFKGNTPVRTAPIGKSVFLPLLVSWHDPAEFSGAAAGLRTRTRAVFSRFPAAPLNPDLLIVRVWRDPYTGTVKSGSYGEIVRSCLHDAVSSVAVGSTGELLYVDPITGLARLGVGSKADIYTEPANIAYVSWSDIGYLNFAITQGNVAGNIALDWGGNVYAIRKLRDRVIVYGTNGVSFLVPSNNTYGLNTLYRIGVKARGAVAGDNDVHFFIDNSGNLVKISEGIKMYDYSEFLSSMTSAVTMSYDNLNKLLYICDGVSGFVFDEMTESLGQCPATITAFVNDSGLAYIGSPVVITNIPFEICTDIYDFNTRSYKTINSIEIGTNVVEPLDVAIDYRRDKSQSFVQSLWHRTSPHGRAYIPAFGREFRFRVKIGAVGVTPAKYEYFELDYIKVDGIVNDY